MKTSILSSLRFLLVLLFFAGGSNHVSAQDAKLNGKVIDGESGKVLPFAHIYLKNRTEIVTTSNPLGNFSINYILEDTLIISFIGYQHSEIALKSVKDNIIVKLVPLSVSIPTISITEESDVLYRMLARSKKTKAYYSKTAKTYFFQESKMNEQTNEMIEAYYNGKYTGYDLEDLQMKNGRIGLQAFEDRYFINMQSSKALMMHEMMIQKSYFPKSPVGLSKKRLQKEFVLSYRNRYIDDDKRTIYEIEFQPKKESKDHFSGVVWIDSVSSNIQKIELEVKDSESHPFLPIFPDGKIEQLDLSISKTFVERESKSYPREINFSYRINYLREEGSKDTLQVESKALLYAFDYENEFELPKFSFPIELENDYRKINAIPENRDFWMNKPFQLSDDNGKTRAFFRSPMTIQAKNAVYHPNDQSSNFFEHPYVIWKGRRVRMKEMMIEDRLQLPKGKEGCVPQEEIIEADQYKLEVQLFMDINKIEDTLSFVTAAIFDPYESYFYHRQTQLTAVFINIYFDLAEIQNRKLANKLKGVNDLEEANRIYEEVNLEYQDILSDFKTEVRRGKNLKELKAWNDLVREELGIDNFEIFQINEQQN